MPAKMRRQMVEMNSKRDGRTAKVELLRLKISQLLLDGYSERQIATAVGRSPSTVNHHVKFLLRLWRSSQAANISKWIGRQLASLAFLEAEAIGAWERSKSEPRKVVTVRSRGKAHRRRGRPLKIDESSFVNVSRRTTIIETAGDPDFLLTLAKIIGQRSALLGLASHMKESSCELAPEPDAYDGVRAKLLEAINGHV